MSLIHVKDYKVPENKGQVVNDQFKYLVIETGYTFRLLDRLDELCEAIEDLEFKVNVEFIYDDVWGEGLYSKNGKVFLPNKIIKHMTNGLIVFTKKTSENESNLFSTTNAIQIGEILKEFDYCKIFNLLDVIKMKDIIILRYDSESG